MTHNRIVKLSDYEIKVHTFNSICEFFGKGFSVPVIRHFCLVCNWVRQTEVIHTELRV